MEGVLSMAAKEVLNCLSHHPGIKTKIRARGKFELYFHLELIRAISNFERSTKCWSEVELKTEKGRNNRRSHTLDLVIRNSKDGCDTYTSVEVKMIVTNYRHGDDTFIAMKNKNVTNAVDSFIADVSKHLAHRDGESLMLKLDGTEHKIDESYSLALVYPMPQDNRSIKAWKKHVLKMDHHTKSNLLIQNQEELRFGKETVPVGIYILKSTK